MATSYTACLDRYADNGDAILLLEVDGETVDQIFVNPSELPEDARHEGAILGVTVEDDELFEAEHLEEEEERRHDYVNKLMDETEVSMDDLED